MSLRTARVSGGAVAICGLVLAVVALLTPPLAFNDGLGNDGRVYAQMATALRDGTRPQIEAGFAFRILPSAIVALMPVDVRTGFTVLNVVALLATAPLLVALMRRYGATVPVSYLGLAWWLTLPMAARWSFYYPVLADTAAFFWLVALIVAALARRYLTFAIALVAGTLTRENVAMVVAFLWRGEVWPTPILATSRAIFLALPAVVAYVALQYVPLLPPAPVSGGWLEAHHLDLLIVRIATNRDGEIWRSVLTAPLSFGLLFWLPILNARQSGTFLVREVRWGYYLVLGTVIAFIGGTDHDRYLYVLTPVFLVLSFGVGRELWVTRRRAAVLTVLQLVAIRFGLPIGPTEPDYFQYAIGLMTAERMWLYAALAAAVFGAAVALLRWAPLRHWAAGGGLLWRSTGPS